MVDNVIKNRYAANMKGERTYTNFDRMYEEIAQAGFPDRRDFRNDNEFIHAVKPVTTDLLLIVLKWLPKLETPLGVLGYLRETKEKYDGRILIPMFNEVNEQGKWRICDAIAHNPPLNIDEWVKETYLDKQYDYGETGLLPLAVAKMFPKDEARAILKRGFDHHYRVTPDAFGKVGKVEDIPFLEERLLRKYDATHVHKDIEKAIARIKKRAKLL